MQGFILDKKMGVGQPTRIENAKVLVGNIPMDTDKIKMYGARVKADSLARVGEIEEAEKEKMRGKCERIAAQGCNFFTNRQLIYNYPEEVLAQHGVNSLEHAGAPRAPAGARLTISATPGAPRLSARNVQTSRARSGWRSCWARRLRAPSTTPTPSASARASSSSRS